MIAATPASHGNHATGAGRKRCRFNPTGPFAARTRGTRRATARTQGGNERDRRRAQGGDGGGTRHSRTLTQRVPGASADRPITRGREPCPAEKAPRARLASSGDFAPPWGALVLLRLRRGRTALRSRVVEGARRTCSATRCMPWPRSSRRSSAGWRSARASSARHSGGASDGARSLRGARDRRCSARRDLLPGAARAGSRGRRALPIARRRGRSVRGGALRARVRAARAAGRR